MKWVVFKDYKTGKEVFETTMELKYIAIDHTITIYHKDYKVKQISWDFDINQIRIFVDEI